MKTLFLDYGVWPTLFAVCYSITIVDWIKLFLTIQISVPLDIYLLFYIIGKPFANPRRLFNHILKMWFWIYWRRFLFKSETPILPLYTNRINTFTKGSRNCILYASFLNIFLFNVRFVLSKLKKKALRFLFKLFGELFCVGFVLSLYMITN